MKKIAMKHASRNQNNEKELVTRSIRKCHNLTFKNLIRCILVIQKLLFVVSFYISKSPLLTHQLVVFNWRWITSIHSDLASTQAMQDEIKLLNDENRRLHGLYDERGKWIQNLENELDTCEHQNSSGQDCEFMIQGIWSKHISRSSISYETLLYGPYDMV